MTQNYVYYAGIISHINRNRFNEKNYAENERQKNINDDMSIILLQPNNINLLHVPYNSWIDENQSLFVELNVPGFKKENLKITFDGETLTINGVKEKSENENVKKYIAINFSKDSFTCTFMIRGVCVVNNVVLDSGLLTIELKRINVKPKTTVMFVL